MNTEFIDKSYIITYSNWFEFNGKILAYRKKVLFDITETPKALFISNNNGSHGYWINRKWLSESGTSFRQALYFKEIGFNLHDTMMYRKINYIPLTHNRYEQEFEYMFVFSKGKPKTFNPIMVECKTKGSKTNGRTFYQTNSQNTPTEGHKNDADKEFAYEKGGLITKSFLDNLPENWKNEKFVFDSRIHMLMPGWYPAIPGWHHDDVPRPEIPVGQHFITAGQPDYDNPRYKSEHILGLVNADICPTEFALGDCVMPALPKDELIYRKWHEEVQHLLAFDRLERLKSKDRTLYEFNWETFHTGTKCVTNGWRWFGRVTKNSDRINNIINEIRVNCQVYLEFPMEGW